MNYEMKLLYMGDMKMAFVNDLLCEDEIREYRISDYQIIKPGAGTIDREKNLKLFYTGHPHEDMYKNYFAFIWNEILITVALGKELTGNTVIWKLRGIDIPRESGLDKNEVLEELRNAMRVYGYSGYSIFSYGEVEVEIAF